MTLDPALLSWADKIIILVLVFLMYLLARGQRAISFPQPVPVGPPAPAPVPIPVPQPPAPISSPPAPVPDPPKPVPIPVPAPAPVPLPPAPPVVVPPIGVAIPRNTHITATSFAGAHDSTNSKTSAYTGKIIASDSIAFAIPKHLSPADQKRPIRAFWGGRTVDGPVEDVGPWYDGRPGWPIDPYWETGTRPRAETDNRTNHAGIDLTPGAWKALGHPDPENAKDYISWDWADALGPVAPPVPVPPVGPAQPPAVGGTVLQHNDWPPQSDALLYFGNPASAGWEKANLVTVQCPWQLISEGVKSTHNTITIHRLCAASLTRILNYIWENCGKSQDQINAFGYNIFDGSYNYRPIAGTSTLSEHAYGAALDFNAAANPQHATASQTKFKSDSLIVQAFKGENWTWGGDWSPDYRDAMHFQALKT